MTLGKQLQAADYVVFCLGVVVSLATGMCFAYKDRKHVSSFFFHRGEGQLSAFPVAISMIVTFESSISYLAYPAEVYIHGFMFFVSNIGAAVGGLSMLFIAIPLFYPLQVTSVYEYLHLRHDSHVARQVAMVFGTLLMMLYAGLVIFGAAEALQSVTGVPAWISAISMTAVAIIYTSLGGIKAVVVTDVVQGVIMIVMIFIVLIYGTMRAGGLQKVVDLNKPTGRLELFDFDPNPLTRHSFWTLIFGRFYKGFASSWQPSMVQRLNSTKSIKDAKRVAVVSIIGFFVIDTLVMIEGLVIYAYFANKGCDPLASGQITSSHQIVSFAVLDMFEDIPGLTGLFLAALLSASLSTISSLLSSVSAVVSEDVIRVKWKAISDVKLTNVSRLVVLFCGTICIGIALLISYMKGTLQQITGIVLGIVGAPVTAIFIMSIFIKSTTTKGILSSVAVCLIVNLWMSLGYNFSPGRKHTPWLPLGPTDRCYNDTGTYSTQRIASAYFVHNQTAGLTNMDTTVAYNLGGNNFTDEMKYLNVEAFGGKAQLQGLDYLYSVSYLYFPIIALFVSLAVGVVTSRMTNIERQTPVPSHLMLSLNRQFWKCQPSYHEVSDGGNVPDVILQETTSAAEA